MICSNCGTENRPGRRFCGNCGTALANACVNCGYENDPVDRFCGNCGRPLSADTAAQPTSVAPAAAATQRRLVTVLFADLVGFTPFAEERDAEDVRDTLEKYGGIAREVVTRYGGAVEKFIGDAVMAVWGTPTAHEDDAERAVRAALELTDAVRGLGAEIQARAGVLTGEAAVNLGATDQNLLAGDLVNTAARLQSVAPPGSVLVGESTMRATSASVAYEPAGDQALKGKQAPVAAWQALRVIAQRRGAGRSEFVETPFVGRDEEFRLLKDQLNLMGRDPRTRLVSITGPAGIGKSRLAWELEKYIDGIVDTVYWHRGRCPAYGEGVSFWALGEMVRRRAGLAETDDDETTRERVRQAVEDYVGGDADEREWIEQALLVLLGVEQETAAGRQTLFAAWRRFFENIAARGTTALVFEDLHWADPGLLDFIDHLLDWSKQAPLLVVTLARPELFDRRPDWGASRRTFTALALDPLAEPAMREMLQAVVPDLPESTLTAIVARADGIPLYAVETVRMLLADGRLAETPDGYRAAGSLGDLEVPDSLRSLITSRLDGLAQDDRRVIQDASVLGQTFTLDSLADLTGEPPDALDGRLRQLVRRELLTLQQDPRSPERGQFGFTQSLVREVAYSTLTRPQRRERHLTAARHLEAVGGDELAGALAGHYLAAHEASAAGPEADAVAAQARLALRGAAERAAALGGHKQAAEFLSQALAVTGASADRALLLERHAAEVSVAGLHVQAEESARGAIAMYRETGDTTGVARSQTLLGDVLIRANKERSALDELEAALAELPADIEPAIRADLLTKLARSAYRNQDWQRALAVVDEALTIAEGHRLLPIAADALITKGTALNIGSRILEAMALLKAGFELARRLGETDHELRAAANLSLAMNGEVGFEASIEVTTAALATARRAGNLPQVAWQTNNLLFARTFYGEPVNESKAMADDVMAMGLSPSDRAVLLRAYTLLVSLEGGDPEPFIAEFEALAGSDMREGLDLYRLDAALSRGEFAKAAGYAERAATERPDLGLLPRAIWAAVLADDLVNAKRLQALMNETSVTGRSGAAEIVITNGLVQAMEGHAAEPMSAFRAGLREFEEMQYREGIAAAALAILHVMGPDAPEVRGWAEQSLAFYERIGAPLYAELVRKELARTMTPAAAQPTAEVAVVEA